MNTRKWARLGLLISNPTESSSYIYTSQPTDDIDMTRLLDGRNDYYRLPAQAAEYKKKHIIITDPSIAYGLTAPNYHELDLWASLLLQGFAISVWTDKGLVRVNNIIDLLPALKSVEPIHDADLAKQIANQGMAIKDCYVAGLGRTKLLLKELFENTYYSHLDIRSLYELPSEKMIKLLSCLSNDPLIYSYFYNKLTWDKLHQNKHIQTFLQQHPTLGVHHFGTLRLDTDNLVNTFIFDRRLKALNLSIHMNESTNWLMASVFTGAHGVLEDLAIDGIKIDESGGQLSPAYPEQLSAPSRPIPLPASLKSVKLNLNLTSINSKQLFNLLQGPTALEKLSLLGLSKLNEVGTLPSSLIELTIHSFHLTWEQLVKMTRPCAQLEKLKLIYHTRLGDLPHDIHLPASLKALELVRTTFNCGELERLLKTCPMLEALNLDIGEFQDEMYVDVLDDFSKSPLPLLKKLTINRNISVKNLNQIIQNSPNLEELTIYNPYVKLFENTPIHRFPSTLRKLSLSGLLPWKTFKLIFNQNAKIGINILDLSYCTIEALPDDLSFFRNIKYLILRNTIISKNNLARIKLTFPDLLVIHTDPGKNYDYKIERTMEPRLDNQTGDSNQTLNCQQVFKDVHPKFYRKQIHENISINKQDVKLEKIKEITVPVDLISPTAGTETHTGTFELKENEWTPLTSLTADDKLVGIKSTPDMAFAIKYCKETGIYYIKPKQDQPLSEALIVSFTIEAELEKRKYKSGKVSQNDVNLVQGLEFTEKGELLQNAAFSQFTKLTQDQQIEALVHFFNHPDFGAKSIPNYEGVAILNEIISSKAGACRHRAIAFLALAKALNLQARAVLNDIHAFVEIKKNGMYYQADLSGLPADLKIEPAPEPVPKDTKAKEISDSLSPDNPFRTWDKSPIEANSMGDYVKQFLEKAENLESGKKNALCGLPASLIPAFYTEIFKQKKSACYYLPNLDAIQENRLTINSDGSFTETDSALKQFLSQAKEGDVLLVNWSDFEAKHVGYNSIIDKDRKIRGMTIPKDVTVVSLLDQHQRMREDYYSRFRLVSECPANLTCTTILPSPENKLSAETTSKEICFYDDAWQSTLLGTVVTENGMYSFTESSLLTAIKAGASSVILRNAPWDLPEFKLFVTELLTKRQFDINGKIFTVPDHFSILRNDTPFSLKKDHCTIEPYSEKSSLNDAYVLNAMTLHALFQQYQSTSDNKPKIGEGILTAHKDKTLPLLVTETLTNSQWAKILSEAENNNVKLKLITTPNVQVPFVPAMLEADSLSNRSKNQIIETNDIDCKADQLLKVSPSTPIPVSEKTSLADLIGKHHITKKSDQITSQFIPGPLSLALQSNEKIILKGKLSPALAKQLISLFQTPPYLQMNGERVTLLPGQLTIVTDTFPLSRIIPTTQSEISENDIWITLNDGASLSAANQFFSSFSTLFSASKTEQHPITLLKQLCDAYYTKTKDQQRFNYIELKSMLDHLKHYPQSNPLKSMLRARADYPQLKKYADEAWKSTSTIIKIKTPQPVLQKRMNKLEKYLKDDWYVFIAGSSGVGKSTTVQQAIRKLHYEPVTIQGSLIEKLKEWVKPGAKRMLFIDEANLFEPGELDILEGLYGHPPRLILNGIPYDVPKDNRLIFAGNFGHFEGRQQLKFISRHGNVISFKEFDDGFLKEDIMQPICKSLGINHQESDNIKNIFLKIYHLVNSNQEGKHPLTARNLQMMIMRFAANRDPYFSAYDEVCGVLNKEQRKYLADWMKSEFKIDVKETKREQKELTKKAVSLNITKKRINPFRILNNLISIREQKLLHPELASAGSNGLILEGNSGIGKSYLGIEYLRSQGFEDGKVVSREQAKDPDKRYYHIQAGDPDQIKKLLIKAFHEGAVVIIDEMNTMLLEHTLNALLSGTTPEGQTADHPGFFIIGTQNPVSFGNRSVLSDALLNRFQKLDLKDYDRRDLLAITKMLHGEEGTEKLVDYFLIAQQYARLHHKSPEPTPRDLFLKK